VFAHTCSKENSVNGPDVPTLTSRPGGSLRWRLPIGIAAVMVVMVGTFLAVAFREVRGNLVQAAGVRVEGAANRLAILLALSTRQRIDELKRAAADEAVRAYLQQSDEASREVVGQHLRGLPSPNAQIIELWTKGGEKILSVATPDGADREVPTGLAPAQAGVGPFTVQHDKLFTEAAVAVTSGSLQSDAQGATTLGFLVVRRPIALSTGGDMLSGLVGNGAVVKVGNTQGAGWTDLNKVVDPPPAGIARTGASVYDAADGQRYVGAMSPIVGTPWSVLIEFPHSIVLAPARSFLRRMVLIALGVVVAAGICLRVMTGRMLTPLFELTQASERIAAGEYSRRVTITRRDEIGRLGAVFNAMTERVEKAHLELEERVRERTSTLEETLALLAQRVRDLDDSRKDLDHFFALTPDMLCVADLGGRFIRVNTAWEEALGWTADELVSAPFVSFVHPDDVDATIAETAKLGRGDATLSFENRYRRKDGSFRWLSWRAVPVASRGLIYAAARDVTDEKRAARELEERATELEAVNSELEAFSYSVSHDLRAPLRHIGGFAALLRDSASVSLDANGQRLLATIINAATRMGRLIDDLLSFSRVGRTTLEHTDVNLAGLVQDVQREVMTGMNGHEVDWRLHELPVVQGDRALLRLAFVNLLSNAVKYSSKRPQAAVEVGTMPGAADETVVFVRDNGAGFDMKYAPKLFGVFQRLHSVEEFDGTGIGLANVRRIVHRHGGRVWAEGEVDRGAVFFVALPRRASV
jgi:PAS domain S-box-containing protein